MIVGVVKGHVVSSAKVENLEGKKLLVVEILSAIPGGFERTDQHWCVLTQCRLVRVRSSSSCKAPRHGLLRA